MIKNYDDYPRVLFITPCAFNRSTGGGVTFGNLFAGWPKDKLATVHNDPVPVTMDVCEKYYQLSQAEIRRWIPKSIRRISAVSVTSRSNVRASVSAHMLSAAKFTKGLIFGNGLPEKGTLTQELEAWISEFDPDLIYTILGSNGMLELVGQVKERFQAPLAIHIMDDWPSSIYRGGILSGVQRRTMRRLLSDLMWKATLRIAICDVMATSYESRYGVPFLSFQNAIDVTRFNGVDGSEEGTDDNFRILYIGSILGFAQRDSLIDCCRAVARINESGKSATLTIYSPDSEVGDIGARVKIHPSITLNRTITDDELYFDALEKADLLLLPVNFDRRSVRYIKYSMPTKVPAYLASGTPILVYGPESVAQVEYAMREGWGEVVSRQGVENLTNALAALMENREKRLRLSRNARQVAHSNHDSKVVCAGFQQALIRGASGTEVTA